MNYVMQKKALSSQKNNNKLFYSCRGKNSFLCATCITVVLGETKQKV